MEDVAALMIPDLDIHRAANLVVNQHGEGAWVHAVMRADELLDQGDLDGQRVWLRILKAVKELLAKRSAPGQRVQSAASLDNTDARSPA